MQNITARVLVNLRTCGGERKTQPETKATLQTPRPRKREYNTTQQKQNNNRRKTHEQGEQERRTRTYTPPGLR